MKKVLLFSILCFLFFSCTKTYKEMTKATIKDYTGLDGCGMVIELENGDAIEPVNLTEFSSSVSIADGQKVWVKYHSISAASFCMVGQIVQIDELRER